MIERGGGARGENGGYQQARPVKRQSEAGYGKNGRLDHQQGGNQPENSGCNHPDASSQTGGNLLRHLDLRQLHFCPHQIREIGEKVGQGPGQAGVQQPVMRHRTVSIRRRSDQRCDGYRHSPVLCRSGDCS